MEENLLLVIILLFTILDIGSEIFTPIPLPPKHASTSDYGTK